MQSLSQRPPIKPPKPPIEDADKWAKDNGYRLPKVVAAAIMFKTQGRVFHGPRPETHNAIQNYMRTKHGFRNFEEGDKEFVFGFILETLQFANRELSAACALENDQVYPGSDLSKGLFCEHLVQ